MIVEELEHELEHLDAHADTLHQLATLESLRARLEDELAYQKTRRPEDKRAIETIRRALHRVDRDIQVRSSRVEDSFNPNWGLMFKEGNENSRFGGQVEDYACLYTSRVSNFLFTSPMQYFRSPRTLMPHEVGTEPLSPFGADERSPGDTLE